MIDSRNKIVVELTMEHIPGEPAILLALYNTGKEFMMFFRGLSFLAWPTTTRVILCVPFEFAHTSTEI